jgi:hypothetical protein
MLLVSRYLNLIRGANAKTSVCNAFMVFGQRIELAAEDVR